MRPVGLLLPALVAEALLLAFSPPSDATTGEKGKDLFARRCSGCHAADINKEGPRLRGVYGRKAGGVPEFAYSDSVRKLNLTWDAASLDRWLTDPDAMAPDTDMAFRMGNAEERSLLIAYLKSISDH